MRMVDPTAPDVEARIDDALDELLECGRQPGAELHALHARQREGLAVISTLVTQRMAAR
jgi:hypothetical protein